MISPQRTVSRQISTLNYFIFFKKHHKNNDNQEKNSTTTINSPLNYSKRVPCHSVWTFVLKIMLINRNNRWSVFLVVPVLVSKAKLCNCTFPVPLYPSSHQECTYCDHFDICYPKMFLMSGYDKFCNCAHEGYLCSSTRQQFAQFWLALV